MSLVVVMFLLLSMAFADGGADIASLPAGQTSGSINSTAAFTSGADCTINGDVTAVKSVTIGAKNYVGGSVNAGEAFTSGERTNITGNVNATKDLTLGAYTEVYGDVNAGGTITLGANAHVHGSAHSGTGVIVYGENSSVDGKDSEDGGEDISSLPAGQTSGPINSTTAFTGGAGSTINGDVTAVNSVTIGPNSYVGGSINSGEGFTSGDRTIIKGDVNAKDDLTLGAYSVIHGDVYARTITLGANSLINGSAVSGTGVIIYGPGSVVGGIVRAVLVIIDDVVKAVLSLLGINAPSQIVVPPGIAAIVCGITDVQLAQQNNQCTAQSDLVSNPQFLDALRKG
jgi:cytoskeletal protein CcmA (bactofilin family)